MADDPAANPAVDPVDPPAGDPPADPPADPPVKAKVNGEGESPASDDWRVSIEDDKLREHAGRFTSAQELAKAHLDLRGKLSKSIVPLGKKPTDEQVTTYRKATGIPETAEGYKFTLPEGHELTDADKAFQSWAGETFHAHNISADQANGLSAAWNEYAASVQQAQIDADKAYADESEVMLKKEWPGKEFDRNKAFADHAATRAFGDNLDEVRHIETKDGRFILDHPAFLKMLASYGREMQEGTLGSTMTEGDRGGVQSQIDDLQGKIDKATAENDRSTAQRLYTEQQELYRKIYGSAPAVGAEGRTV